MVQLLSYNLGLTLFKFLSWVHQTKAPASYHFSLICSHWAHTLTIELLHAGSHHIHFSFLECWQICSRCLISLGLVCQTYSRSLPTYLNIICQLSSILSQTARFVQVTIFVFLLRWFHSIVRSLKKDSLLTLFHYCCCLKHLESHQSQTKNLAALALI